MKNLLLTSLVLFLVACGRASPHDKLIKALETTSSWTATAQMVGEAWQQGDIPDQYAQQTLTKSQDEISKALEGLHAPSPLFQQVQQVIQEMTSNIEQHNRAAITTSLQTLSIEQQQLHVLAQAEGAQL